MNFFKRFKRKQKVATRENIDFLDLLKPMLKSSIRVSYDENYGGECPVGSSKIGGKPDLPPDFQWYYYRGKSYEETIASLPSGVHEYVNRENIQYNSALPLSFIAQINCDEIHEYDKDKLLPSKGMLYFFYELANMTWGDIGDKGGARVYYYSGSVSELQRTDFPSDLKEEFMLPEMPMTFYSKVELPDFEEFIEWHDEFSQHENVRSRINYWNIYDETKTKLGIENEYDTEEDVKINKLLGYANLIQAGMLLECEVATKGIKLYSERGGYSDKITKEELRQYKEDCTKWQLLFQLESIVTKKYEMLWGDVGRIYFYVNSNDLRKLNFENCWLILQCS